MTFNTLRPKASDGGSATLVFSNSSFFENAGDIGAALRKGEGDIFTASQTSLLQIQDGNPPAGGEACYRLAATNPFQPLV